MFSTATEMEHFLETLFKLFSSDDTNNLIKYVREKKMYFLKKYKTVKNYPLFFNELRYFSKSIIYGENVTQRNRVEKGFKVSRWFCPSVYF